MKKYWPYLLVIVLLLGGIGWYFKTHTKESINQREGSFGVPAETITRIVIEDAEKGKAELAVKEGRWLINGKHEVRPELMKQLLEGVSLVKSLTPVPSAAHDNVIRELMAKKVKVQVFENGQAEPSKVYYVGGPTIDNRGTYMLLEIDGQPASRPHITYIPGYLGYLTPRFSVDEENWRSRIVFNQQEADIEQVSVTYPAEPANSFVINRVSADSFTVNPANEQYRINQPNELKYVKQYLSFYQSIYLETFDNGKPGRDSIAQTTPYCIIKMKAKGVEKEVKMFYMELNERSKSDVDINGNPLTRDIDHYYATINGTDFAIVQYYVFGKLLRNYKDFYYKPK